MTRAAARTCPVVAAALVLLLCLASPAPAAAPYSGNLTYTFKGPSGDRTEHIQWKRGTYLFTSTRGEFLLIDLDLHDRIYVCAPTLAALKKGPTGPGAPKVCGQFRTTGTNFGLADANGQFALFFYPLKNYLTAGRRKIESQTFAGIRSNCFQAPDTYHRTRADTLCVAASMSYLTYMNAPNAHWKAIGSGPVRAVNLRLPAGARVLTLQETARLFG